MLKKEDFFHQTMLIFKLGLPIWLGQIAQMSMGFVDTVIAGRAGAVEMAGVAVGGAFWVPLLLFGQGMLNCIGPLVAQGRGAGKENSLHRFWRQGLWLSIILSIFLLILFTISSSAILHFDAIEPELALVTANYIDYIKWGMPAFLLFFVCRFFLEGKGQTRPAMVAGFAGLICNIPLNFIFVFGYFGMPALGGAGCGLASAVVCWIMLGVILYYLKAYSPKTMGIVKPNKQLMTRIARIGFPGALALLLEVSSFALISLFIAPLGSVVVAGHQVAMNMVSLVFMCPLSLGIATSIRIGICLGAKKYHEAKLVRQTTLILSIFMGLSICVFLLIMRIPIAHMYSTNPEVIALASSMLILGACYQIPDNIQIVVLSALRGYNDTKAIFVFSIIAYWCISLPIGYLLCFTDIIMPKVGVAGFWMGLIIGLTVVSTMLMLRILHLEKMSPEQISAKIAR